jgi:hypothetical protein
MRPLRCSRVISDQGMSKWTRWLQKKCRFTPSGHVGGQQDAHGGVLLAEVLDDLHLLGVGQADRRSPR